jgi:hypothetical protein
MDKELTLNERRNFFSRKKGIFKKAFEIGDMFNAQICVLIRCESIHYAFRTDNESTWPPNFEDVVGMYIK